ncbi:NitT/TauT family transport system permease protein [Enhydrobacter aerosaccus]|uniref:NitT/TauT family transport system permease protein n=1 Tax=Enhydrobacter aerosaccus TaxID=225324 RepID=A0A1T4SW33_9HYPH|nr:ABC transporter permease [Enhydrobacter aerosaccus]SKA32121.1 NitT/TauT family transport system permease protein [Enhydrobacter aerosaccus]
MSSIPASRPSGSSRLFDGVLPRARHWLISIGSVALGLVVWHLAAVVVVRDPVLLPGPLATAQVLIRYLSTPYPADGETLIGHALVSMARVLAGFAVGSIIGIAVGALMAGIRGFRAMVDPFIEITRPLPPLAFVPVLIVWFGIGEAPKIILIAAGVVPVMAISTAAGLDGVSNDMLNCARCLGASEWYTMLHVRIRAAMPQIITGMRLSVGLSWTSIVAVEMIAATAGLGFVILQAGQFLNTSLIFSGILIIAALGLAIDAALRRLQWHLDPSMRP